MKHPKLYIGPMSKNVVDAVIEYANQYKTPIGLIPSRRQVDFSGGYVNGWTTDTLCKYVRQHTSFVPIMRDHGGPHQGTHDDRGYDSFYCDAQLLDIVHIDPWRQTHFKKALKDTVHYIKFCLEINEFCNFEIGTEQAIFGYEAHQLDELLNYVKDSLRPSQFSKIKYAVIQSGTSLKDGINTGEYSEDRLSDMLDVCARHEIMSKEHNGDYLDSVLIHEKFRLGLDSINIAPEFGQIETAVLVGLMSAEQKEKFYKICLNSGKWKKWTSESSNRDLIIKSAGHYMFSHPDFLALKETLPDTVDAASKKLMKKRIHSILGGKS